MDSLFHKHKWLSPSPLLKWPMTTVLRTLNYSSINRNNGLSSVLTLNMKPHLDFHYHIT